MSVDGRDGWDGWDGMEGGRERERGEGYCVVLFLSTFEK